MQSHGPGLPRAALLLLGLVAPIAPAFELGGIPFARCELGGRALVAPLPAQCATVALPADPADPANTTTLPLRLAVLPARDSQPSADALLFIAGGPGQSALASYPQLAPALDRINQSRHIVLIDQRGTGASAPLNCAEVEIGPDATDGETIESATRLCLESLAHDPRWFTTSLAVADFEALRQRLAIPQWNLYGVSYGTRVALEYLRRHPGSVRSALLDGVVDPQRVLGIDFGQRLDQALVRAFAKCSEDPGCQQRFPDPMGALRVLKAQLAIQPVAVETAHPRSGTPVRETVDAARLTGLVRLYAYASETRVLLPLVIDQAARGQFGQLLAQSLVLEAQLDDALSVGMQLSVLCSEDLTTALVPAVAERESLLGDQLATTLVRQCGLWPRGRVAPDFHQPVQSAIPALLLSGELDPVTPPADADAVLAHLGNARHLIAPGQGHNVLPRGCLPRLAAEFVQHADPAALDAQCLETLKPAPYFLNLNGAAP